jgi:hypothetical protein
MMMKTTFYTMNPKFLQKIRDPKNEYLYTKTIQTLEDTNHDLANQNKQLRNEFWKQEEENSDLKKHVQSLTDKRLLQEQKQNTMILDFKKKKQNLKLPPSILENAKQNLKDEKKKLDAQNEQKIKEMHNVNQTQKSKIQEQKDTIQNLENIIKNLKMVNKKSEQTLLEIKNHYEEKILSISSKPLQVQENNNKIDNSNEEITIDQKTKKKRNKKKDKNRNKTLETKNTSEINPEIKQIDTEIIQEKPCSCEIKNQEKITDAQNKIIQEQNNKIQDLKDFSTKQILMKQNLEHQHKQDALKIEEQNDKIQNLENINKNLENVKKKLEQIFSQNKIEKDVSENFKSVDMNESNSTASEEITVEQKTKNKRNKKKTKKATKKRRCKEYKKKLKLLFASQNNNARIFCNLKH